MDTVKVYTVVAFNEPRVLATFQKKEDADLVAHVLYQLSGIKCSVAEDTYNDELGYVFRSKHKATEAIVGLLGLLDLLIAPRPSADDTCPAPASEAPHTHQDP